MKAVFVLTPAEGKRIIAKAAAKLPEIETAMAEGRILFAAGTTNIYVAEELLGEKITDKARYCFGVVTGGWPA
ncbi:MAG: hypothetical protein ACOX8W_04560 [bacterium]|jgi:hypothetical protein